ncbi:sugar transferase [Paracidobacterium acidisoli]|uniref:sugar transferase n=1 Tax=Paracidobacterium acidisoli TaxID=2303751 RepID=UPI0018F1A3E8|nr:sugar transferase [Paracidobacterium acidisoli]
MLSTNLNAVTYDDTPSALNLSPWVTSGPRRFLDCAVALFALALLAPALLLVALAVYLSSAEPVLFRQRRMGRNGQEFTLYKFRSMRTGEAPGSNITVSGDARITPVGAFLRRFKLDELPQFWNVLKGDMSLVGPRPKLPQHEALCIPSRPGITGPATLAFRHEEEILRGVPEYELESFYENFIKPSKARIDLEYMQNASLRSDLKLMWQTVASCVGSSAEYENEQSVWVTAPGDMRREIVFDPEDQEI